MPTALAFTSLEGYWKAPPQLPACPQDAAHVLPYSLPDDYPLRPGPWHAAALQAELGYLAEPMPAGFLPGPRPGCVPAGHPLLSCTSNTEVDGSKDSEDTVLEATTVL